MLHSDLPSGTDCSVTKEREVSPLLIVWPLMHVSVRNLIFTLFLQQATHILKDLCDAELCDYRLNYKNLDVTPKFL